MTLPDPLQNDPQAFRARRGRSIAIALTLAAFVILVFTITVVRLTMNSHAPFQHF